MPQVTLDGGQSSVALGGQVIPYVQNLVAQQVSGAPDQLINTQLTLTLREFYTKSTGWRDNIGPYPVNALQPYVQLNPLDQNRYLQFVHSAFLFPYEQSNSPQGLIPLARKPIGGTPQPPSRYYMEKADVMYLYPIPDKTYGRILYVYGTLIPTSISVQLPDIAYTQHLDALIWGTFARLYMMPKRPWTDKQLAQEYSNKYRREILIARDIAQRGMGPSDTPGLFPRFGSRGGSQVLPRAVG